MGKCVLLVIVLVMLEAVFSLDVGGQSDAVNKIDPALQAMMETQSQITVLILGSDQLMNPPDGYQTFIEANASTNRLTLRDEVITELKSIAQAQQPFIMDQLDHVSTAVQLWLVNAIEATVSPDTINQLAAMDEVRYLYPTAKMSVQTSGVGVEAVIEPNPDRSFSLEGKEVPWNVTDIGAERTWRELEVYGEGTIIASIDSGINYLHQDLINNVWINESEIPNNGIDDDANGYIDDLYGFDFGLMNPRVGDFSTSRQHGTWTSGIIVGDGSGGILTGIAPLAQIMMLKGGFSQASFVLAFQYALEHGADVMTMSFSIPGLGQLRGFWRLMAEHAIGAGMVLVSGAGNFQQTAPHPVQLRTPEDIPALIAVGGVGQFKQPLSFSSTGPVEWSSVELYQGAAELIKPDVSAFPGAGYPLLGLGQEGYDTGNRRGNSFSGPHAAGTAALMLSAAPTLPAWRVKAILESTATDLGDPGKDNITGAGLINAFAAVELAISELNTND